MRSSRFSLPISDAPPVTGGGPENTSLPRYVVRTARRWLGDPDREPVDVKLNTGWLIDNYGEDVLQRLPVGLQPLHRGDGVVGDVDATGADVGNAGEAGCHAAAKQAVL